MITFNSKKRKSSIYELPCDKHITFGNCPFGSRCKYIHDPRISSDVKVRMSRRHAKIFQEECSFFWPVSKNDPNSPAYPISLNRKNLDQTIEYHGSLRTINSVYYIPTSNGKANSNRIAKMWKMFCMVCQKNKKVWIPQQYNNPILSTNCFTGDERLPIFQQLSRGIPVEQKNEDSDKTHVEVISSERKCSPVVIGPPPGFSTKQTENEIRISIPSPTDMAGGIQIISPTDYTELHPQTPTEMEYHRQYGTYPIIDARNVSRLPVAFSYPCNCADCMNRANFVNYPYCPPISPRYEEPHPYSFEYYTPRIVPEISRG